jgi:UDP-2-acetamido-2-deoxy-ribo-hexuluronate aminotransferase
MEFIDLACQQQRIREILEKNIQAVLNHGKYILGPEVKVLEEKLAGYVGAKHAIACASGTDALLMALMAYNIGPGDAIFTTPFTFIATAEVISLLGATPVFVDIDPETFNIDPVKLEEAIDGIGSSSKIFPLTARGILPVDLFGLPADYDRINAIAKRYGLFVIEDAAQSFGAEYKCKKACTLGDIACTSFFPAKPLGCYGDGGMCFSDDDNLAEVMRSIRVHGKGGHKYDNIRIGINGRLDTLQAAILLAKFTLFKEEIELRNSVAERYTRMLSGIPALAAPLTPPNLTSVWAQYSILASSEQQRSVVQEMLNSGGIPTAIYYPKPLHLQDAFSGLGYRKGDFPVSEDYAGRIFSLPMHPYIQERDQERIAEILSANCDKAVCPERRVS